MIVFAEGKYKKEKNKRETKRIIENQSLCNWISFNRKFRDQSNVNIIEMKNQPAVIVGIESVMNL
jgi:hypothetical protein